MQQQIEGKKVLIQMRDLRIGNGIAACIMNYYEFTIQQGFKIEFLLNRNIESPYVDLVGRYGSRIYVLPHDTGRPNKDNEAYIKRVVSNGYDVIHVNMSGLNALVALKEAKHSNIPIRIYHSHNPRETSSLKAYIRSVLYETPCVHFANRYASCSTHAGDSVFKDRHYTVLKNAMNTSNFRFDEGERRRLRNDLCIEDKLVIGVVGRLAEQKNPLFTIDVFSELKKICPNTVLLWVGDGDLRKKVEKYAAKKGVYSSIKLLGVRKDINKLYSAMDVLLLPSKFEGLGIVFIEAQIAGLECFGSHCVPIDCEISEKMHRISLNKNAKEWAQIIYNNGRKSRRSDLNIAEKAGYEITMVKEHMCKLYE